MNFLQNQIKIVSLHIFMEQVLQFGFSDEAVKSA